MSEQKVKEIADEADMIIRGYAFKNRDGMIYVFNINDGFSAMVMSKDGTMLETNMNEIEQALVKSIWEKDSRFMEEEYA